jgi:hypothetical protein
MKTGSASMPRTGTLLCSVTSPVEFACATPSELVVICSASVSSGSESDPGTSIVTVARVLPWAMVTSPAGKLPP